jgi:hypothetical protein
VLARILTLQVGCNSASEIRSRPSLINNSMALRIIYTVCHSFCHFRISSPFGARLNLPTKSKFSFIFDSKNKIKLLELPGIGVVDRLSLLFCAACKCAHSLPISGMSSKFVPLTLHCVYLLYQETCLIKAYDEVTTFREDAF